MSDNVEEWLDNLDPGEGEVKDGRHMREISEALESVEAAEIRLRAAVMEARAAGDSWAMIGTALGTSRQAAFQRFGAEDRAANTGRPLKAAEKTKARKRPAARSGSSGRGRI